MESYFIGIDIGTQGARVVLADAKGDIISSAEQVFPLNDQSREEQSPKEWWDACYRSLSALLQGEEAQAIAGNIEAIAVTSTSGTVIPLDENNQPLHNAIMYSDKRSVHQAEKCTAAAVKYHHHGYTAFNFSSGLAKMIWFQETYPEKAAKIAKWIHAADFVTGMLSNVWGVTDYTNAFKSGYDVSKYEWPEYLYTRLPLKKEWLPQVVPSGTVIGTITAYIANELGLPKTVKITAGITDGCASQIASGAINPGEWNTTIGTTMVIKGVTKNEVPDPHGRLYSHRHPEGYWMPGGASNTGADWVTNEFGDDLLNLNEQAGRLIPTRHIAYPLRQEGERFPFIAPQARGFEPEGLTREEQFAANMEGVAYLERYTYEMIEQLSGEKVNAIYTAGGASNSDTWLRIRSNVLNKPVYKMKHVSGAMGAAMLATSKTYYGSLTEAVKQMVLIEKEIHPEKELAEQYEANYREFIAVMQQKGYIKGGIDA
ncbi:FGGY-family carbohydrate kinase [Mucilaginibacter sabulilitoris]|uniref:FGGY-family carbohydrate kinase n=1 Tax=Mucilaginibacter sabulilitoris TaxID=1173583 RepID=A0ABZ0TIU9_9SPHI|nr:FGGY-family carbohydrate kinase [Mucilaginibacter sabulilitoris]WPU92724.1 FGGY-family carbohydrate kinase [Mucilaginibacter sabulilitoris]